MANYSISAFLQMTPFLYVSNTSTLPVTLHQGIKVATAELVDKIHINGVLEID